MYNNNILIWLASFVICLRQHLEASIHAHTNTHTHSDTNNHIYSFSIILWKLNFYQPLVIYIYIYIEFICIYGCLDGYVVLYNEHVRFTTFTNNNNINNNNNNNNNQLIADIFFHIHFDKLLICNFRLFFSIIIVDVVLLLNSKQTNKQNNKKIKA